MHVPYVAYTTLIRSSALFSCALALAYGSVPEAVAQSVSIDAQLIESNGPVGLTGEASTLDSIGACPPGIECLRFGAQFRVEVDGNNGYYDIFDSEEIYLLPWMPIPAVPYELVDPDDLITLDTT